MQSKKLVNLGKYRVHRNNRSKYVFLPKTWADTNGIEVGDEVEFSVDKDGTLCVRKAEVT